MDQFSRINRLPPYVFSTMDALKQEITATGVSVWDLGMGNPDQPAPAHIVDALRASVLKPDAHRYAASKGIDGLRRSICEWYGRRFNVDLDPAREAIATVGSKEGIAHLAMAITDVDDTVLVPNPCYPVHHFGFVLAGADVTPVPLVPGVDFIAALQEAIKTAWPKPKVLVINFPSNPTAQCVDLDFFAEIIAIAKEHNIWVIHDLAYADLVFDGYRAPSILEVPGAKDIAVEFFTLSKSYNMAGWRVGFMCGNATLVTALSRIKSYIDYGSFMIRDMYQRRRDVMCAGLNSIGWDVTPPKATMFVWAKIPDKFHHLGSLEFAKRLLSEARVVVSPGVGFGEHGNQFVRIGLVDTEERIEQAIQQIKPFLASDVMAQSMRETVFV
jgi:alanine-synthesizing transaminase